MHSALSNEQTAKNTSLLDQEEIASYRQSLDQLSTESLDNALDFFGSNAGYSSTATVNHLLQFWLLNQRPDFADKSNANLLDSALMLVNFLTETHHHANELYFFKDKLAELADIAPPATYASISLEIATAPDDNGSRSELTLLREALGFYEQKLRSDADSQQNPALLLDAANLHDMQANLTDAAALASHPDSPSLS